MATLKAKLKDTPSFLADSTVRWYHDNDKEGFKLSYADFRQAWVASRLSSNAPSCQKEEVMLSKAKKGALTFEQCCRLICLWFPEPKDAVLQIVWLRKLLRRPCLVECGIFVPAKEGMKITKKISHELNLNQISPLAKSMTLIQDFVSETQAPSDSEEEEPQMEAEEEEEEPQSQEEQEEEEQEMEEEEEEQQVEEGKAGVCHTHIQDEVEDAEEQEEEENKEGPLQLQNAPSQDVLVVKALKPLELKVHGKVGKIGRVQVPGRGSMVLTYDIIMAFNNSTQNATGKFFRELSTEKKSILKPHLMTVKLDGISRTNKRSVIDIEGAYKLMMFLPNTPPLFKCKSAHVLKRYLDGDSTLTDEILQNQAIGPLQSHMQFAQDVMDDTEKMRREKGMPEIRFIYACASPAFPSLIKIGKTEDLVSRLSALNTSCAPAPHKYVAVAQSLDYTRDEKMAHAYFAYARKDGEFFQVTEEEVATYFEKNIEPLFQMELKEYMLSHPAQQPSGSSGDVVMEEEQEAEQARAVAAVNNAEQNIQVEIPRVQLIEPLQMLVGQEVKSFGRVEVPGRGKMLLTYDIIMGINNSTHNTAGNCFRELSDDKKKEVSLNIMVINFSTTRSTDTDCHWRTFLIDVS